MSKFNRVATALAVLMSVNAFGTVFIVPDDRELVQKSGGVVTGTIVERRSQLRDDGYVETVYEVRVERAWKGAFARDSIIEVVSDGGISAELKRMTAVPGTAHFEKNERVLLFLTKHEGRWTPTGMTLGKFRYVTSTGGHSLLLRDADDIVGFDKEMRTHVERIRREQAFLAFIEETVSGGEAPEEYFVAPEEAVSLPHAEKRGSGYEVAETFTPRSYAVHFMPDSVPGRWAASRMSTIVPNPFFKSATQNASGLPDGGIQMMKDALNAWNSDCGSFVNAPYNGTIAATKNYDDNANVVVWNDPGNHIPDSAGGVIAKTFLNGGEDHTFGGEEDWVMLSDADIVIQNGYTGAEPFMATVITHEIGHALGLRHADRHFDESACHATDECSSAAIMKALMNSAFNYTLQNWDRNAIRALYPGACPPAAPTGLTATAVTTGQVNLTWTAAAGATSYKIYRRTAPGAYTEVAANVLGTSYSQTTGLAAYTGYEYVVRASNLGGDSADSNADFTVTAGFTDAELAGRPIKAVYFNELRTAANALRTLAGLAPFSFSAPTPGSGVMVRASYITELRSALNAARLALGGTALSFGENVTSGLSIKASYVTELREGVF